VIVLPTDGDSCAAKRFNRRNRLGVHAEVRRRLELCALLSQLLLASTYFQTALLTTNLINKKYPSLACARIRDLLYSIGIEEILIPII
jgi:hypothetical protein